LVELIKYPEWFKEKHEIKNSRSIFRKLKMMIGKNEKIAPNILIKLQKKFKSTVEMENIKRYIVYDLVYSKGP